MIWSFLGWLAALYYGLLLGLMNANALSQPLSVFLSERTGLAIHWLECRWQGLPFMASSGWRLSQFSIGSPAGVAPFLTAEQVRVGWRRLEISKLGIEMKPRHLIEASSEARFSWGDLPSLGWDFLERLPAFCFSIEELALLSSEQEALPRRMGSYSGCVRAVGQQLRWDVGASPCFREAQFIFKGPQQWQGFLVLNRLEDETEMPRIEGAWDGTRWRLQGSHLGYGHLKWFETQMLHELQQVDFKSALKDLEGLYDFLKWGSMAFQQGRLDQVLVEGDGMEGAASHWHAVFDWEDAQLNFHPGWPLLVGQKGRVEVENGTARIKVQKGHLGDDPLLKMDGSEATVSWGAHQPGLRVQVDGLVGSTYDRALAYVRQAPALQAVHKAVAPLNPKGLFNLELHLDIQVADETVVDYRGKIPFEALSLQDGQVEKGQVDFTSQGMHLDLEAGRNRAHCDFGWNPAWSGRCSTREWWLDSGCMLEDLELVWDNRDAGSAHFKRLRSKSGPERDTGAFEARWQRPLKNQSEPDSSGLLIKIPHLEWDQEGWLLKASGYVDWPSKTALKGEWFIKDTEKMLAFLGYSHGLTAKYGQATFEVEWPGAPWQLDWTQWLGHTQLVLKEGSLRDVGSGLGKLVSLVSIENLHRRLQLDFRDFFQKGLFYDAIQSNLLWNRGTLKVDSLQLTGPVLDLRLHGDVLLNTGLLDLEVAVMPKVTSGLPLAAGLAAGSPVVGAGVWVFDQLTKKPMRASQSYQYQVSGDLKKPQVSLKKH